MVADTLTKSHSDVSRPTDAFHNICLGGQICIRNIVDAKLLNRASLHRLFRVGATVYMQRHLLITQKAPLRYDATLPTPAPMFLVLRTRFATSACITMSTNPVRRKSSRHIDMRVHYCRELYTAGVMKLIPLRTHLMVADALTKSLPGPALSKHRDVMMGHMPFFARLLHCGSQSFYSRFLHSA